ncbi:MAG: DNA primase [Candidatus Omnitrophota bacterium]
MGKIPEHILNEIQDRCDIVEVISSYIPLKSAGRNFKTQCPFHHEKTPSFIVSPDKQIYHCFGCNSGGNVFNFIKEYEKVDFIDAVKMLAEKVGVKLPKYKDVSFEETSLVASIYNVNELAANFYSEKLKNAPQSSDIKRYIERRGLEEATIKKFKIGYAEQSWSSLCEYLLKRGIAKDIALKAGLILKGKENSFYDLFRKRLTFPIHDARGKVIGFGARVLDDSLPKYINSPETAVYKKAQSLYGLDLARSFIREKGFAIICEGYLDVITSHQYGICNAISSSGTALTVEQIRLLRKYTRHVVMVYDADQAGEMATLRGLDLFLEEGMSVKVASLDKGHDPDSFIRKFGPRGLIQAIKKSESLFTYKLNILKEKYNIEEPEGKTEISKEMLFTICKVRNSVLKAEYIKRLAQELSTKEEMVWEELKKLKKPRISEPIRPRGKEEPKKDITVTPAEKILLRLMLEDIKVIDVVRDNLKPFDFKNSSIRHLVETLFSLDKDISSMDAGKLINYLENKVEPHLISFLVNEDMNIRDKGKNVSDCINSIKKDRRDLRLKDIQNRLVIAQKNGHEGETKSLLEEFNRLIKKGA